MEAPAWTPKVQVWNCELDLPAEHAMVAPAWTPKVIGDSPLQAGLVPTVAPTPIQCGPAPIATQPVPCCSHSATASLFRVACPQGVVVRAGPHFKAALTGAMLGYNEIFGVSQEIAAYDGRVYLRLTD